MNLTAIFKVRDQGTAKLRQLTQVMDKMNRSSRTVSEGISKTQSSVSQLGNTASSTSSKMDGLKSKLAGLGAAVGVGSLAKSVVGIGAEFEASMSKVAAVSGATGSDLSLLELKAREMGANTNKSASEAADALGYMALAGWDTQQMLGGIEPILKLSTAGNMDLARTSDLVTDSMAAMGIKVQDLPGYLDMVAQASRRSNTEIESLMDAFLVSGGQFASLNVPLAESTSLLGILANRGYKGAEAGTAMNAILTNLTTKGGESGKAMKQLGISMWDAQGNFVGLEAGLMKVKDKLAGLTQEQRNQAISMIAGKEHLKTFQALLSGLGAEYGSLKDDISNSSGVLENLYKIMTDNLKGDWDTLKSGLSEAAIAIFQQLVPALRAGLKGLSGLASYIPSITDAFFSFAKSLSFLKPLLVPLGTFLGVLLTLVAGSAALSALGAAFSLLVSPVGLVAAAITAVVLAFATAYKKSETFRNAINGIGSAFKAVSEILKNGLKGYGTARNLLEEAGFSESQIQSVISFSYKLKDAFDKVKSVFSGIGTLMTGGSSLNLLTALGFSPEMATKVDGQIKGIKAKVSEFITNVKSKFGEVVAYVTEKITQLSPTFDRLKEIFSTVWSTLVSVLTNAWTIIEPFLSGFWNMLQVLGDIAMVVFNNVIMPAISFLVQLFSTLWSIAQPILTGLGLLFELMSTIVKRLWDKVLVPFIDFITTAAKNAFDNFAGALEIVQGWFETLSGWVSTAYGHVKDFIGFIGKAKLPDWVTNGISAGVNFVGNIFGGGKGGNPKSHYSGLDSVPYDGYTARLHKSEKVLTAREAKEYDEGRSGGGINIAKLADQVIIREDADIDEIAYKLAKAIEREATQVGYKYY
ncbi:MULTISPECIES: phage tail tape measure protein [unclassified Lysinibacillus]|uniref:phage tail tape measure protein n=1 Tax=unclassified Lysinibacillus TaxID=2636778 RepID=UPI0038243AEB